VSVKSGEVQAEVSTNGDTKPESLKNEGIFRTSKTITKPSTKTSKPAPKQASKPGLTEADRQKRADRSLAKPKVITDLEEEFRSFEQMVERWERGLSTEDYHDLIDRVQQRVQRYIDNILCEEKAEVAA